MRALAVALWLFATPALADVAGIPNVIDGDTIEVHGQRIRLHGIVAPESRQLCRLDGKPSQCGKDAANALADKIARPRSPSRFARHLSSRTVWETHHNPEAGMTYPQAVIIGAAIITGALLFSDLSNANQARQGGIAISSTAGGNAWVARGDGKVRLCYARGTDSPVALAEFKPDPVICSDWR